LTSEDDVTAPEAVVETAAVVISTLGKTSFDPEILPRIDEF
jgi:hypothetical protein